LDGSGGFRLLFSLFSDLLLLLSFRFRLPWCLLFSQSKELPDEPHHLGLLHGARFVVIEAIKDLVERRIIELVSRSQAAKRIDHKPFGFLPVKGSTFVDIIVSPDLVNEALDILVVVALHVLINI